MKKFILVLLLFVVVSFYLFAQEQLSAWNDTASKVEVISYVNAVVDSTSAYFVPIKNRIAVFDLDGTLMCEKPNYILSMLSNYVYSNKIRQDSLQAKSEFNQKCLQADSEFIRENYVRLLLDAFTGVSQSVFMQQVREFMNTQQHSLLQKEYINMYYVPMAELVAYLQENKFQIYICSGSDTWFIRAFCDSLWNISPQNVMGTDLEMDFNYKQGTAKFIRQREILKVNNRAGKAENLFNLLQAPPLIAVGNSEGDRQMLQYAESNKYRNLILVVNHDDKKREYNYLDDSILQTAKKSGWTIISIKRDFKQVFPD